jgi:betaine-homocysteine S-methyltransferase
MVAVLDLEEAVIIEPAFEPSPGLAVTATQTKPRGLLERLDEGVVLGDGGYLLELERRGWVQAGPFTPEVSITHPEALLELHREFARAGAEILQALTFYASEEKLATVGLAGEVPAINRAAVRIAKRVADEVAAGDPAAGFAEFVAGEEESEEGVQKVLREGARGKRRERPLVAGGLSLTWAYDPSDMSSGYHVRELFLRQLEVQAAEGVDLVIAETFGWLNEALIAIKAAKEFGLPVVATMAFDKVPRSYESIDAGICALALLDAGADVIGVNCLRDPSMSLPLIAEMKAAAPNARLACQPVAYRTSYDSPNFSARPEFPFALESIALTRGEMEAYARAAKEMGVSLIGSCCGSVAIHVAAMAKALGKPSFVERDWRSSGRAMSAYEKHGHLKD